MIDPDNAIDEVHETRDTQKDPGGNNEGYFDFSVENANTAANSALYASSAVVRPTEEGDGLYFKFRVNGKTYEEFYDTEITGKNGPVEAEINVTNITNFIIPDIKIVVWYIDVLTNDIEVEVSPMSKTFTLFPNETYTYVAMLDADMTDKFRKAGKYRAIILCESPDNLNVGASAETPSVFWDTGDEDPDLEVYEDSDTGDNTPDSGSDDGNETNRFKRSSSGCDSGFGGIALILAGLAVLMKRKQH